LTPAAVLSGFEELKWFIKIKMGRNSYRPEELIKTETE
jgi:hypothetical protein